MKAIIRPGLSKTVWIAASLLLIMPFSCTTMPTQLTVTNTGQTYPAETILSARTGQPITFDALVEDLAGVQVVYVGETHTNRDHHLIQARLIEALYLKHQELTVGMEMFDPRYDPILARWSAGELDREAFIKKSHWYARGNGWGFPFELYAPIFDMIQEKRLRLVGLNYPSWIRSKISTSGIENLLPDERRLLAAEIDTGNAKHRAYVEEVFNQHGHGRVKSFDYFYEVQCAWEDTMAEAVARNLPDGPMVVVIGNGHIRYKYGVPDRAYHRSQAPFRTVYLAAVGSEVNLDLADYIWVTP